MQRSAFGIAVAVGLLVLAPRLTAQTRTRLVFVKASNASGPLLSPAPSDFTIRENGNIRTIVSVRLATAPMRVALIVDNSEAAEPALANLRAALRVFVQALPAAHEIVLVTTGSGFRVHGPPTTDRELLTRSIDALSTADTRESMLLDSLVATDTQFQCLPDVMWPVFVILTNDGAEASTKTGNNEFNALLESLTLRAATVHAIEVQGPGGGALAGQVASALARVTGGHHETQAIRSAGGLSASLRSLAETIAAHHASMANHYRVEFDSGAATPQPIEVAVTTDGRAEIQMLFQRRAPE